MPSRRFAAVSRFARTLLRQTLVSTLLSLALSVPCQCLPPCVPDGEVPQQGRGLHVQLAPLLCVCSLSLHWNLHRPPLLPCTASLRLAGFCTVLSTTAPWLPLRHTFSRNESAPAPCDGKIVCTPPPSPDHNS